jgi:hypothetical protein
MLRGDGDAGRTAQPVAERVASRRRRRPPRICRHHVAANDAQPEGKPIRRDHIVHPFLRRGYRFKGRCDIFTEGETFDLVANELWQREGKQYPVNAVVRIQVDTALPVRSPAYVFNKGVQEDDVRRIWLERYGVQPLPTSEKQS